MYLHILLSEFSRNLLIFGRRICINFCAVTLTDTSSPVTRLTLKACCVMLVTEPAMDTRNAVGTHCHVRRQRVRTSALDGAGYAPLHSTRLPCSRLSWRPLPLWYASCKQDCTVASQTSPAHGIRVERWAIPACPITPQEDSP